VDRFRVLGHRVPSVLAILAFAGAFRLVSAGVAFLLNVAFPDYQREQFTIFGSTSLLWDPFARYDSGWYFQIARFGFHYTPNGRDTIAFFPVYPILMRHVGRLLGPAPSNLYLGGIVVSWLSFALALVGLYRLARRDLSARRALHTIVLATVFPFAYFFGVVYTESTFLAATVWCFYFFRTRRWIAGGVAGAIATATRVNGILMWPALAWLVWRDVWTAGRVGQGGPEGQGGRGGGKPRWERVTSSLGLALVPTGIAAYSWFVFQLTGSPFEWVATVQRWGYHPGGAPWLALWRLVRVLATQPYAYLASGGMAPYDMLNGLAALAFALAAPLVWWRLGASYGLFMVANLWLQLSSGQYEGLGRYCSVLFPFFIWLASVTPRTGFTLVVGLCAMLYVVCLALFVNIHPLF